MIFDYSEGATPIDPNDESDLIPKNIATQSQLNEVEFQNIVMSRAWSRARKHGDLLTTAFMERLHKRMYGDVWKWAGKRRIVQLQNEKFADYYIIATATENILADFRYRLQHARPKTQAEWNRLGAEFHHRIVKVHYFKNGNGRHARELTELLLMQYGQAPFTWGSESLSRMSETRDRYIEALHAADDGNYSLLTEFVRT
ncbi:MAG: mobile mystery protein B [Bacteroidota bacterium]|nr:mobile mystery protein B [Bacteroidota bacterium]MDP4233408.1 mobile mystery protein B [Bacteroidota bacterium]MDP4242274.1 mobile mystery protein B [Bacteroidota bacterium]MDP4287030.1 mobile mystery protein B [Bacteroidota bacterium]